MSNTRYRFVIESIVLWLQVCIGLNFIAMAPLLPLIIEDYQIDRATASLLVGALPLIQTFLTVPASMLAAKIGQKRAYALGALLMSAGLLTPLGGFPMTLALRIVSGAGIAFVLPLSGAIVMGWFSLKSLPVVNSLNIVGQSLGIAIAMFAAPFLGLSLGWRAAPTIIGGITLAAAMAWLLLGRQSKQTDDVGDASGSGTILQVLGQRTTILLGLAFVGGFGQNVAMSTWLPSYYSQVLGFPLETAGLMVSLIPLFGIVGALAGGFLPTIVGLRRPFIMASGLFLTVFGLGSFLLPSQPLLMGSLVMLGIFSFLFVPVAFTLPMELPGATPVKVGMMLAVALSMGNFAGFLSPLLVGFLTDLTGTYLLGLSIAAVSSLTLFICGALLPETGPRARVGSHSQR